MRRPIIVVFLSLFLMAFQAIAAGPCAGSISSASVEARATAAAILGSSG